MDRFWKSTVKPVQWSKNMDAKSFEVTYNKCSSNTSAPNTIIVANYMAWIIHFMDAEPDDVIEIVDQILSHEKCYGGLNKMPHYYSM